jgi:NAD(P)-dependent dehydrogenase (short-subunit alcohol dehydrogenase family)
VTAPRRPAVIVSGASRGIGLETALALAAGGFDVWAGYRDEAHVSHMAAAAAERGVFVRPMYLDVSLPPSAEAAVAQVVAHAGAVYGVVNNAAVTLRGYFEDLTDEEIRRTLDVNLFGTMNLTRAALPHMRGAGRGRIVMMSSVGGRIGSMTLTAYIASKFAIEGFSESLSLELEPLGIQVVIIEPGIVDSGIWHEGRRVAARARDASGPYYEWFTRAEEQADALVKTSRLRPADVAAAIHTALTARRPRLRYTVGRRASFVMSLRRHLPGELFERFYFGEVIRRVTGGRRPRPQQVELT